MASVMAATEQKMEVTWNVALLIPALNHVAEKHKEGYLLEVRQNNLSAPSSWRHTHTWPGLELPGLMASHWHLLPVPCVGLAVTVDALSTTEKAL